MAHIKKRGWYCTRCPRHEGPCALRPLFWNVRAWILWHIIDKEN